MMASSGKGRIFKRADGKWLVYLPMDVCTDSQFPFKESTLMKSRRGVGLSLHVKVTFDSESRKVILSEWGV